MRDEWLKASLELARTPSELYAGDRKVFRHRQVEITGLDPALTVEHAGYTHAKLAQLTRLYVHEESRACAVQEWASRINARRKKPFSVGFHTYNHLLKARAKHGVGSVMRPCMQSVALTSYREAEVAVPATPWDSLRHTFCSELARRGVPVNVIKELAGHKSIETTLRYMHTDRAAKRAAIDALLGYLHGVTKSYE